MAVPAGSLNYVKPTPTVFELEALEGLPCGCVAAAFRARPWDVARLFRLRQRDRTAFSRVTRAGRFFVLAIFPSSKTTTRTNSAICATSVPASLAFFPQFPPHPAFGIKILAYDPKILIAYGKRLLVQFEGLERSAIRWP